MSQDEKWKNGEVSGCYRWAKLLAPVMIAFLGLFGGALVEVRTGAITTFITTIVTNISMGGTLQGSTGTTPQAPIGSTRQAPAGTTPVSPLQPLTGAFTPSLMMENSNCIPSQDGDRYIFQNTNTVAQCVLGLDAVAVDWQRLTF